jgi:hypothetical protein
MSAEGLAKSGRSMQSMMLKAGVVQFSTLGEEGQANQIKFILIIITIY